MQIKKVSKTEDNNTDIGTLNLLHGEAQDHANQAVKHALEAVKIGGQCGRLLQDIKGRVGNKNWTLWKEGNLEPDMLEWSTKYERIVQQDLFNLEDPRQIRSAQNLLGIIPQAQHKAREERDNTKSWEAKLSAWANRFGELVSVGIDNEQRIKMRILTMELYKWLKREVHEPDDQ